MAVLWPFYTGHAKPALEERGGDGNLPQLSLHAANPHHSHTYPGSDDAIAAPWLEDPATTTHPWSNGDNNDPCGSSSALRH